MKAFGNINNPEILVIGCFHGDEPQGKFLIEEYLKVNQDSKLCFVPCLNSYGVQHNIRTNENGVDLNRNFPTKNWVLGEKDAYYGGDSPASEIQTKFIIELIQKYPFKAILSLHAPYKVVNYDGDGRNLANKISEIINYPVEESIGYPTPGSFGTWAGIEQNIPTITLELDEKIDVNELKEPVFKIFSMLEGY